MIEEIARNSEWVNTMLTDEEVGLLREHTVNPAVWTDPCGSEPCAPMCPCAQTRLDNILSRVPPTTTDIVLYSGGEVPLGDFIFSMGPLNLPYFTSSYDRTVAEKYARMSQNPRCASLFVLRVPAGSKIVCLDTVSAHGNEEREVFLSGQATLTVVGIESDENFTVVHANYRCRHSVSSVSI